jgi:predicted nuclease of restriction endonuclease-like (RecB) superfamily
MFPGNSSFTPRNLWLMRQFYVEYVDCAILKPLVAEIPWAHNIAIMSQLKFTRYRKEFSTMNFHQLSESFVHNTL